MKKFFLCEKNLRFAKGFSKHSKFKTLIFVFLVCLVEIEKVSGAGGGGGGSATTTSTTSSTTTPSLTSYLSNDWSMSSLSDSVGGATLNGTGYSFTYDMFCNPRGAIYVNKSVNLKAPTGVYFSDDFTLIVWINLMTWVNSTPFVYFGNLINSTLYDVVWLGLGDSTQLLKAKLYYNSTISSEINTGRVIPNLNQWYHVAYVLKGNNLSIYVDGIQNISETTVYVPRNVNRNSNFLGLANDVVIGETKIYQIALSSAQILSDYKAISNIGIYNNCSGFTTTTTTTTVTTTFSVNNYLSNSWSMSSLSDSVGGATLNGTGYTYLSDLFCNPNEAIYVNKNYLQAPSGVYFSGNFTLVTWIYLMSFQFNSSIIDFGNGNYTDSIVLGLGASGLFLKAQLNFNSSTGSTLQTGSVIQNLYQWQHIAYVLAGTTHSIYVNGVLRANGTTVYVPRNVNRATNYIGMSNDVAFGEMKIFQMALNSTQILSDYRSSSKNESFNNTCSGLKVLKFLSSNNGATLDKTLQITFQLYTYNQNENIYVNYGDGSIQTIAISSSSISNYTVPSVLTNPVSSSRSAFLLLNTEFYISSILTGFRLYGALAGVVNIQIVSSSLCGQLIPCAVYYTQNPFYNPTSKTLYSWNYTITTGLNVISLSTPVPVYMGNLVLINQITGRIAINTTGNAKYSDLVGQSTTWSQLNSFANYMLYFNTQFYSDFLTNIFTISRKYTGVGLYNLTISFSTSNQTFTQVVNITDYKYLLSLSTSAILNRTVTLGYTLLSQSQNETIQINFGDSLKQNITINNAISGAYSIPTNLSNPVTNTGIKFLLLNNEFLNDTTLFGFELYAANNGTISLQILSSNFCEKLNSNPIIPCAVYFSNYPSDLTLTVLYSWNFSVSSGYNKIYLNQSYSVSRGNLVGLTQLGAKVAIDTSGNTSFSDFNIDNTVIYSRINNLINYQFYLNTLIDFTSYQSNFNITHSYKNASLYNMSITFLNSNLTYYQAINVTDNLEVLNMLSSNILGNSINLSYILYSSFVSDTVLINYGDSQIQTIAINMMTFQAYSVPQNTSRISSNSNSSFILLNTEIPNDTYLFGFDIYTVLNGTITIEVATFDYCGSWVPCAVYFSNNYYNSSFKNTIYVQTFTTTLGFNRILLNQPSKVYKGSLLLLTQISGLVAIDESISSSYSDLVNQGNILGNLSYSVNKRFLIRPLTNFSSYYANISISHVYINYGSYNLTLTFANTQKKFTQAITTNNLKSLNLLSNNFNNMLDHTVNMNLSLYTDKETDQILVDFGDSTSQLISLVSTLQKGYMIPFYPAVNISNNGNSFLLLNNEFLSATTMFGFEFYSISAGLIIINLVSSSNCGIISSGFSTPCAFFLNNYPFNIELNTIESWNYSVDIGYNKIYLQNPINVQKGQFISLRPITAQIAIDSSGYSSYSDLVWNNNYWSKLNNYSNWRIYFDTINNFLSFQTFFNVKHTYNWVGLYNLTVKFLSSNISFIQTVNITDYKNLDIVACNSGNTLNKNINCSFNLLTNSQNSSMIISFGDNKNQSKSVIGTISYSYNVPLNVSNPSSSAYNQFLLLNNEFREDQFIFGFIIYGSLNSYINPVPYLATNYWNVTVCNTTLMLNKTLTSAQTTTKTTTTTTKKITTTTNKITTTTNKITTTTDTITTVDSSNTTQMPTITGINGNYYNLTLCNTYLNSTNISMINYTTNYFVGSGKIKIEIVNFDICGTTTSCATHFSNFPYNASMNVSYSFNYTINSGYNKILFSQPILVKKGSLIFLTQSPNSSKVAIDQSGNASYSDMIWGTNLNMLNSSSNWRFYLTTITNFSTYQSRLNIQHSYNYIGLYNLSILFTSSNELYNMLVNITDFKSLDLLQSNTGNTLDKSINNTYNIYTACKNDTVLVNYGDGLQQTLQLTSTIIQNFVIPLSLTSTIINSNQTFLLLNTEFHNQTYLSGFQLYAAINGSITIQIASANVCGSITPCAVYFSQNPYSTTMNILYSWNFDVTVGYNNFLLSSPVTVFRGNFIILTQNSGYIALYTAGNASYSDMAWNTSIWTNLVATSNWRFYLTATTNFSVYQNSFNIIQSHISVYQNSLSLVHTYNLIGIYNLSIKFLSANQTFEQTVNVTDLKVLDSISSSSLFTMDKTLNNTYILYSAIKNDTIFVNFGDSIQNSYQLNSGIISNYAIPQNIITPMMNINTSFILLNTEIHNQTNLFGFNLYAATSGSIDIMVVSNNSVCGLVTPCAVYMTQNPFNITMDIIFSWNFNLSLGFNSIMLPQPVKVYRGCFLTMTQITGRVAIDITGSASYSDLVWTTYNQWTKLAVLYNWRFYLTPLTNFSSYMTTFNIMHTYSSIGIYNLEITFASSNETFNQIVNITDLKVLDIFNTTSAVSNDKMLNVTYLLQTGYKNDSFIIDFGDSSVQTIYINSAPLSFYSIPQSLNPVVTNPLSYFLLLNSEFMNDSAIYGFTLFSSNNGTINIQVVNFTICGVNITCGRYFSRSHYPASMFQINSWTFSVVTGFNNFVLDQAFLVKKGSMIYFQQNIDTAQIAIDTSGTSLYSDIAWGSYLQKLNAYRNYRFYLEPVFNFSTYQTKISLFHRYSLPGLYNVSLTSLSSNQYFENLMNITDLKIGELICPNINRTLVKLINCTFLLYTQNQYDQFIVDYDDFDDETDQILIPYPNRINFFGANVPQTISSPTTDTYGSYLLLNSEFQNDTRLLGFQIYGQTAGIIQISIYKFSDCGILSTCAYYFSYINNTFQSPPQLVYSWNLSISVGYNKILFNASVDITKSSLIQLNQAVGSGKVALETLGNATYSDMKWGSSLTFYYIYRFITGNLTKISTNKYTNYRFYLNSITEFEYYQNFFPLVHRYSASGLFNLTVRPSDSLISFSRDVTIDHCFPATLIVENYSPNFSLPFQIPYILNVTALTTVIYNCSLPNLTNISTWSVSRADPLTGEVLQTYNLSSSPFAISNKTSIFFSNGTFKYGLYKFFYNFTLITTDETVSPFISTVTHYIKVVPTGFIVSGFPVGFWDMPETSFTFGPFESLSFVPAFYSYDSDFLVNQKTLFFSFYCTIADLNSATTNTTNFTSDLYYMNPNGELTDEQLAADDTCFKSTDLFYFDVSGNSFAVPNGFQYQYEGKYYRLFISTYIPSTKKYANITYNLNVVFPSGNMPVVSLFCKVTRFCSPFPRYKKITKNDQIVMRGACVKGCSNPQMTTYTFKVFRNELDFNFHFDQIIWTEVNMTDYFFDANYTTITLSVSSLLFKEFPNTTYWKVELLTETITDGEMLSGVGQILLKTNQAPYNGSCNYVGNLTTGYAIETYFTVNCTDWLDEDGFITGYEFFATFLGNNNPISLKKSKNGNDALATFQLPHGSQMDDYQIYIYVHIIDDSDGIYEYNIPTQLTVLPNQNLIDEITRELINSIDSNSSSTLESNSTQSSFIETLKSYGTTNVTTFLMSFTAMLNSEPVITSNSSGNNSNNTYSNEQALLRLKLKEAIANLISSLPVDNVEGVIAVSNSLSSLSSNPSELNINSVALLSNKTAELSAQLLNKGPSTPLKIVNQAAGLMADTMASSLIGVTAISSATSDNPDSANQTASQVLDSFQKTSSLLANIANMTSTHLSLNENSVIKTGSMELSSQRSRASSFGDNLPITDGKITMPNLCEAVGAKGDDCANLKLTSQVFTLPVAVPGADNAVSTTGSKSIALSFYSEDQSKANISHAPKPFEFAIPRDTSLPLPEFKTLFNYNLTKESFQSLQSNNDSNSTKSGPINLLLLNGFSTTKKNVSIHVHVQPTDETVGYFAALKFGGNPYLNRTYQRFDIWKIFCPWMIRTEDYTSFYVFFANMSYTIQFEGFVGFGIKQLHPKEFNQFCANGNSNTTFDQSDLVNLDTNTPTNFTQTVSTRVILSGCYYIDEVTGLYSSYGMEVLETTNTTATQCIATHLTQFAGGFIALPSGINFNDVWANASFLDNITIYMTIIVMCTIYILGFLWTNYQDRKDKLKTMIKILPDNECDDIYFYEVLFYTGSRVNAGTDSVVNLKLFGDHAESRTVEIKNDGKLKNFRRGAIDSFVMSCNKPLGTLEHLRVSHDNSGKGSMASWFLKFIVVHDLQTREKFYFICNSWLDINQENGSINRLLSVAGDAQKTDFKYLFEKQTKEKLSDGHMWFSIIGRPVHSSFTRTDRLTCCFVLLFLSMLMNIMYYGVSTTAPDSESLNIGPVKITPQQISVGVITNLIVIPPSILIVNLFRRSRRRVTKSAKLRIAIKKIKGNRFRHNNKLSDDKKLKKMKPKSSEDKNLKKVRRRRVKKQKKQKIKNKKGPLSLPWWGKIIAYLLSYTIGGICIFFIIVRGISFGNATCTAWLTSVLISLFTSLFLTQPIQVFLITFVVVAICRKANDSSDEEVDPEDDGGPIYLDKQIGDLDEYLDEMERKAIEDLDDGVDPHGIDISGLKINNQDDSFQELKLNKQMQKKAETALKEILLAVAFALLAMLCAYQMLDKNAFGYQTQLQSIFGVDTFLQAQQPLDIWNWAANTFVPQIKNVSWYNGNELMNATNLIRDYSSYIVGYAIIRQKRITESYCSKKFTYLQSSWQDLNKFYSNKDTLRVLIPSNESCYYDYNVFNEDKGNYGFNWASLINKTKSTLSTSSTTAEMPNIINSTTTSTTTTTTTTLKINTTNSPITTSPYFNTNLTNCFKYTKSKVLKDNPFSGRYGTYLGGGYVYNITSDLDDTIGDLQILQSTNWIDKSTRAVFFELTLYNPSIDMFCSLQFLFEILPTGQVLPNVNFNAVTLWTTSREVMATACIAVFLVVMAILIAKEVKSLIKLKKAYFQGFWVYIDWSLFAITITSLPMYLYKIYALHDLQKNMSVLRYTNLTTLTICNANLAIMLALCSFLVTIKLVRLLRHNRKLAFLIVAVKNGTKEMTSFLVVFLIMYMAFVQLMFIMYNDKVSSYATFVRSMMFNFLYLLGYIDPSLLLVNYTIAAIVLTSYIIIVCIIMLNFLITILSQSLTDTRNAAKNQKPETGIIEHFMNKAKSKLNIASKKDENVKTLDVSDHSNNIEAFEKSTKQLIDALKGRIQSAEFSEI